MAEARVPRGDGPAPFWTLDRLHAALAGGPRGPREIAGVATDTRAIRPGECFVALAGEHFDAHDFLGDAVKAGAAALVVRDARLAATLGVPVYEVEDTLAALGALGRYKRLAWARPVIAVIGSNGKTSTKELLKATLGSRLTVHATSGNLNNRIGVPLTLLALPDHAEVAVVEAGTNLPGEIAILREIIRPDVAVITTVQEEHLEGLGDLAGVMAEELAMADGTPLVVAPAAEPDVVSQAKARGGRVCAAGLDAGDRRATAHGLHEDGRSWLDWEGVRVEVPLRGAHNLRNATLALAVASEFGIAAADAAAGLGRMPAPPMRSDFQSLGRALLINDAYNANPGSARAALELLRDVGGSRQRVAVLGTMRELGAQAARAHREVAEAALAQGHDVVAGIGEFGDALRSLVPANGAGAQRVVTAIDVEDLWPLLRPRLARDAAILLKASRGVKLERLVPLLTAWAMEPIGTPGNA